MPIDNPSLVETKFMRYFLWIDIQNCSCGVKSQDVVSFWSIPLLIIVFLHMQWNESVETYLSFSDQ